MPCDSTFGDGKCVVKGSSRLPMKRGCVYFCSRILLKGGVGWGMSLYEKLNRQGLIPK